MTDDEEVLVIPVTAHRLLPIVFLPLEILPEQGPLLVCGEHDWAWPINLSGEVLEDIRRHVAAHTP